MKYVAASSPLPIKYEKKWFIPFRIYTKPWALSMENWDIFDQEVKKKHPIQYFFRDTLCTEYWAWKRKLNHLWWKIKNHLRNPRKEMRNIIFPPEYRDLPEIIFHFNAEVVKDIYEREKYFDKCEPSSVKSKRGAFERGLKKYYKYITVDREKMNHEFRELFEVNSKLRSKKSNKDWMNKMDQIDKLDNQMCVWVASHREYFWT